MSATTSPHVLLLAFAHSYRSQAFAEAVARVGATPVRGLDVPAPLLPQMKAGALALDYNDIPRSVQRIQDYAREHPVRAILGLDDSGSLMASAASAALGLAHNSVEATQKARSKYEMRQAFARAGVPSPGFQLFHAHDDPRRVAGQVRYPCVLKPTTLAGSQGVMRADAPAEFVARWQRMLPILRHKSCDEILVEDYLPGREVALEGLLDQGRLHVLALFDKPDPLEGPFFEETIYVTPSRLPASEQQAIAEAAAQAATAMGLHTGPLHAELRINADGPWLLEVAARSIGGLCAQTLRFGDDISLEELIVRQALGMPYDLTPFQQASPRGVMMIPIPAAGILQRIEGVEAAQATPGIVEIVITAPFYHALQPLPEGDSYLGFIFAQGDTPAAVEQALRAAHKHLRFTILPDIPLVTI